MPIEGPLHELGLQDVFQLLDLSRKTGMLRVTSRMRDDEGVVYFHAGRVVQASLRSKPSSAIDAASLTDRELQRKTRGQIEVIVFDLMSWTEGVFSFEEGAVTDVPAQVTVSIASESLLMESARRIDEWSRIAGKIPHLMVVPCLAALPDDHESQLDLLPHEWEVLSLIDGSRNLRAIATALRRGEFEAAKVIYGLVTTGVVEIRIPTRVSASLYEPTALEPDPEIQASLDRGLASVRAGDFATARESLERVLMLAPTDRAADRARAALNALSALRRALEGDGND